MRACASSEEHLVGNRTISEIESNQSGNCVIARVLPMGERAYSGTFLRARAHIGCQRKASSGEFPASLARRPPSPSLPLSFPLCPVDHRSAIHPDGIRGFGLHSEHVRWPNASRILSEITHSPPKRSGTTPAVRADASYFDRARDYYFSTSHKFSVSLAQCNLRGIAFSASETGKFEEVAFLFSSFFNILMLRS